MMISWFKSICQSIPQVQLNIRGIAFRSPTNQTLLQAALQQGLPVPHGCKVGRCGLCKCRLISGKVRQISPNSDPILTSAELHDQVILACQVTPCTDLTIDLPL